MKKICILLLVLSLLLALPVLTSASEEPTEMQYVYDDAMDLLSDEEEEELNQKLAEISERIDADIVVVLTDDCYDEDAASEDAYQFFRAVNTRSDGAIFYCAIEDGFWNMQGFGEVDDAFTEAALDLLEESCLDLIRAERYYEAFETFAEISEDLIEQFQEGTPYKGSYPWLKYLAIALLLGAVVALIVVLVLKSQLKSVRSQNAARNYLKQGSLNLTEHRDLYLYRTVSRIAKPKESSSGSSGRSGGGRSGRI